MSFLRYFLTVTGLCAMGAAIAQPAIGQWREHFSYQRAKAVVEGDGVAYCATSNAVFALDPATNGISRYSKVNVLNDMNVSCLSWNAQQHALVVGYTNGNVDVLMNGASYNLSDIKRSGLVGDKTIYAATSHGPRVYLACGFGIVVVDLERMEVQDTWIIGPNATQVVVRGIAFHQDSIHAATETGLFSAAANAGNLASFTNWRKRTDIPRAAGPFSSATSFNGRLMVNYSSTTGQDTVYYFDGAWQRFTAIYGSQNRQMHVSPAGDRLTITHNGFVRQYNGALQEVGFWGSVNGTDLNAVSAVFRAGGGIWAASETAGLVRFAEGGGQAFFPNGPKNNSVYRLASGGGRVYVGTGGVASNWGNFFLKYGVHRFKENTWYTTDRENDPLFNSGANTFGGTVNDVLGIAVDPEDPDHVFVGSWDDGVVEMRNGQVVAIHNPTNSSLQYIPISAAEGAVQVAGLTFDGDGNLWMTNSNCTSPISVRQRNGAWQAFNPGSVVGGNTLFSDIVVDPNGYKWIVRPRGVGLLVFDDAGTITDTGDDRYKALTTSEGSGKLPSADVFSVAVDHDGEVWVGTGKGVAVFYNPFSVFESSGGDAQQILLQQDGNYQLLLETEAVSAIAVDGGDRKWLGTQNAGVFLVSADGTEQLEHFTVDNSPLPGNNIVSITIDGLTGEVFFGTDQGIVSFRGSATEGGADAECASVFPNPVRETYSGPVAITGLVRDSDVRVTDVAGNLVYRTTSLGGQAIWPATDLSGQRVSTGVYLILASDPSGTYSCNTKVVVVR